LDPTPVEEEAPPLQDKQQNLAKDPGRKRSRAELESWAAGQERIELNYAAKLSCQQQREMCNSWLVLIIALSVVVCLWNSQQTETSKSCPAECICLSQTQVSLTIYLYSQGQVPGITGGDCFWGFVEGWQRCTVVLTTRHKRL